MIGWSSYLMSRIMVANRFNVHYYERYVNLEIWAPALPRIEGDTAHFLMVTFWESEAAIRAFAGDDISVAKYYDFDKDFPLELEPCYTLREVRPVSPTQNLAF